MSTETAVSEQRGGFILPTVRIGSSSKFFRFSGREVINMTITYNYFNEGVIAWLTSSGEPANLAALKASAMADAVANRNFFLAQGIYGVSFVPITEVTFAPGQDIGPVPPYRSGYPFGQSTFVNFISEAGAPLFTVIRYFYTFILNTGIPQGPGIIVPFASITFVPLSQSVLRLPCERRVNRGF